MHRVPEFSGVWFEMLNNPEKLLPGFTGKLLIVINNSCDNYTCRYPTTVD